MNLIKLGGSVITQKSKKQHFNQHIMDQLATEIQKANTPLILIHGAGSFGHITAQEYALNDGFKTLSQLKGFAITHATVQQLNSYVLASLHEHNIPAVSLPPHAILQLDNHQLSNIQYSLFQDYML